MRCISNMECKKYELSHSQKRVLITQLLYEESSLFNIGGYVIFRGKVDFERMYNALSEAVRQIDSFSIRLNSASGEVTQYFSEEESHISELFLNNLNNIEEIIREKSKTILSTSFELFDSPLYKIIAFEGGDEIAGYIFCCHHLICDGWSVSLFAETVSRLYNGLDIQVGSYKNYLEYELEYLNSRRGLIDQEYWTEFVSERVNKKQVDVERRSSNGFREEFAISNNIKKKLVRAEEMGYEVNTVLCAGFILADYLKSGNAVIAMSNFNRKGREMRRTSGMFTNTLLAGVLCNPEMTLEELLSLTRKEMYNAIYHYQWPYDLLGIKNNDQVFSYNINCYNTDLTFKLGSAEGKYYEVYSGAQDIPFQLVLNTWGDEWKFCIDMRADLYHHGDGISIIQFIEEFLTAFLEKPVQTIVQYKDEKYNKKIDFQRKTFMEELQNHNTLSSRIERVLKSTNPREKSIIYEDGYISYEQLSEMIYGAMDIYKSEEISSGDKILLYLQNGLEYVVYSFAAIASGICFTPLDSTTPQSQVEYLYKNVESSAIVAVKDGLKDYMNIIYPSLKTGVKRDLEIVSEELPAYILYTSGSTGNPKGVVVSRKAIASYLDWGEICYGQATFFLYSSPSFDLSLTTLLLPLTSQGQLVICKETAAALFRLPSHNAVQKVNAIKATPSNLALLLQQDTSKLQLDMIICGGEELTVDLARKLQDRFGDNCKIYNEYGPTECTVGCMCYLYNREVDLGNTVSIGKAAPGCCVYVVDSDGELCGVGKTGEIYLAGRQLAKEYWRLPEENNHSFLNNLFGEQRVYKTGDLGRYCLDGNVEYLGRIGRQSKVNGYRIELDSIERVLKSMSYVDNAAVWVSHKEQDCLLAAVETTKYSQKQLTAFLEEKLPIYCVPYHIYICSSLPVTRNGKIDIQYLEHNIKQQYGAEEKRVVLENILRETLDYQGEMEQFDYLLAGGDSVRALRIITTLEEKGYRLSLADLLDHPRFEDLVLCVQQNYSNNENKQKYDLPKHLQYLSDSCDDFNKYRHLLVFQYSKFINEEKANRLNYELRKAYPSLNVSYVDGVVYESEDIQDVNWAYANGEDEKNKLLSEVYKCNNNTEAFILSIITNGKESWLCYNVHHIIVDGVAWREILHASNDILNGINVRKHKNMEVWKMDEKIRLVYNEFGNLELGKYSFVKKSIPVKNKLTSVEFTETVRKTMLMDENWKSHSILFDFNGRELIELEQIDNIGCYSLMLPIETDGETTDKQIQKNHNAQQIELVDTAGIRVNYLGNINEMVPSNMTLIYDSLELSLESCGAFGCMAEVTGVDNEDEMILYFSWRSSEIDRECVCRFLDKLNDQIIVANSKGLISLTSEEEEELYD